MKMTLNSKLILGFAACVCILICVAIFTFKNSQQFIASSELVLHSNKILNEFDQILISTINAETGTRGFIISGNISYLEPYTNACKRAFEHYDSVNELTKDNYLQQKNNKELKKKLYLRFANLDKSVALAKQDFVKASQFIATGEGKRMEDDIRKTIEKARQIEYSLLTERKQTSKDDAGKFNHINVILLLIIVIILINVYIIIHANLKALKKAEEKSRFLIKDMTVGVIQYGPDTEIQLCNPIAREMLGMKENEYTGLHYFESGWKKIHEDSTIFSAKDSPVSLVYSTMNSVRNTTIGVCHPVTDDIRWLMVDAEPQFFGNGTIRNVVCTLVDITSRINSDEELRESEQRLKFHFENSPLAIVEWDTNFLVTQWSNEAEKIFGWKKHEAIGNGITSLHLIPDENINILDNLMTRLSSGLEETVISSNRNTTKSGDIIDCVWYNSILWDKNKQTNTVMSLVQDITLRKQAENSLIQLNEELEDRVKERTSELEKSNEAIRLTEEKYRTVADFATNWEFWIDSNDVMIYCSPSCESISGYTATEFVQNSRLIIDIIYPGDLNAYYEHKKNELKSHLSDHEIQYRIIRRDGHIRWMGHFCRPVFDENGIYKGIRGSNKDITARKITEELLSTANQKYKLLSENISDGIFICKNGCFEYVNNIVCQIFGYIGNELEGMKLTQLFMAENNDKIKNILSSDDLTNHSCHVDLKCFKKDLSEIFVEVVLNYVSKDQKIYGVIHDITDKKNLQKQIVKAIIQTEEKERAHFSKELHDGLGPLLSTIKLYIECSGRSSNEKQRAELTGKADEIIDEALLAVKEISLKLSPHLLTNYGLNSAIKSFVGKLNGTGLYHIVFESNSTKRFDVEIEAALYRAVIECLNNTMKHSRAKNIYILLEDLGNQIQLKYTDDGIGFDIPETLALQKGLGLFNLQNRIQTFGGKVDMNSQPGNGVDYRFTVDI